MQKIFLAAICACTLMLSCNSEKKTEPVAETKETVPAITYPYAASYSSSFEMGDPRHTETVLKLTKAWDNRNLMAVKDLFADSIEIYTADGAAMVGPRDSLLTGVQGYLDQFSAMETKPSAFFSLKSTDKNEHWALIWATEIRTDKKGKVDSTNFQETWRLNKDGKANLLFQYAQAILPPAPAKK